MSVAQVTQWMNMIWQKSKQIDTKYTTKYVPEGKACCSLFLAPSEGLGGDFWRCQSKLCMSDNSVLTPSEKVV